MKNQILNIDCLTGIKDLSDNSIDCVITSPPYWALRDYGCDGQIGQEETPEQYIETLINLFKEVYRVLKPEGTCFVNLGDTYAGSGSGTNSNLCTLAALRKCFKLSTNVRAASCR